MTKASGVLAESTYKDKAWGVVEKELARTYLKIPIKAGKRKKPAFRTRIPWFVAVIAVFIALAAIFFSSSIDVKIRVQGDKAFVNKEDPADLVPEQSVFLVEGGEPNKSVVKNTLLLGDARKSSYVTAEEITLNNGSGQGWADYKVEFDSPVNLTGLKIRYSAKGEVGGERLILMIIDSDNKAFRVENNISSKLERGWNVYTINLKPLRNLVDISGVSALKFEFGALTAGNSPKSTIYLKDIMVIKDRRLKWL